MLYIYKISILNVYMNTDLYKNIVNTSAYRKSRDAIAKLILAQENLFLTLEH